VAQPSTEGASESQQNLKESSAASPNDFPDHSHQWQRKEGPGVNATELRWSEIEGRHLVAAMPICKGEEILCEAAHLALPLGRHRKTVCPHTAEVGVLYENILDAEAQWGWVVVGVEGCVAMFKCSSTPYPSRGGIEDRDGATDKPPTVELTERMRAEKPRTMLQPS